MQGADRKIPPGGPAARASVRLDTPDSKADVKAVDATLAAGRVPPPEELHVGSVASASECDNEDELVTPGAAGPQANRKSAAPANGHVARLYDSLLRDLSLNENNLNACSYTETKEDTWATSEGMYRFLAAALGDSVDIINPELSSQSSPTSPNENEAIEAAVLYLQNIYDLLQGQPLQRPIVMILNTNSRAGGLHWQTCVILPQNYVNSLGERVENPSARVYFIDSLHPEASMPAYLEFLLKNGMETNNRKIPAVCPDATVTSCHVKHQVEGYDCGWLATYDAIMLTLKGNPNFLTQFQEPSRKPAYVLRSLFPNLDEEQDVGAQKPAHESIPPAELAAIKAAMATSLKTGPSATGASPKPDAKTTPRTAFASPKPKSQSKAATPLVDAKTFAKQKISNVSLGAGALGLVSYMGSGNLPAALALSTISAVSFTSERFNYLVNNPISNWLNNLANDRRTRYPAIMATVLGAAYISPPLAILTVLFGAKLDISETIKYTPAAALAYALVASSNFFPPLAPLAALLVCDNFTKGLGTSKAMLPLAYSSIASAAYMFLGNAKNPTATMDWIASYTPSASKVIGFAAQCLLTNIKLDSPSSGLNSFINSYLQQTITGLSSLPTLYSMVTTVISPESLASAALTALSYTPHAIAYGAAAVKAYKIYNQL